MKKVRCPKCEEKIIFDETRYQPGRILVFECPQCRKRFKVRIKPSESQATKTDADTTPQATLSVMENGFQLHQTISLQPGPNQIGRYVKGTRINAPIVTVDPSIDTTHCTVTLIPSTTPEQLPRLLLADGPSGTGTFLMNRLLQPREQAILHDGDIITIGAATLIVHLGSDEE